MRSTIHRLFLLGVGVLFLAFSARADSHPYNNLSAISNGSDPISVFGPLADSFNSGPSAFSLTSVTVLLQAEPIGEEISGGAVTMTLLSNAAGPAPGSVLDTIGTISSPLSPSLEAYTFALATPFDLTANTTYWIELTATSGSNTLWSWSFDTSGPGVAGQFFANADGVSPNTDGPYQMDVSGTTSSVPEPGILLMLGSGIGALFLKGRRKLLN
jgi:hypothetical protein